MLTAILSVDTGFAREAESVSFALLDFLLVLVFWLRRLLLDGTV